MKAGDIVEWRGKNGVIRGVATESENGELYVRMDNGHSFSLDDLRRSKSVKVIER